MSRITPRDREIAAEYWPGVRTMREVAAQFGVSVQTVYRHVSKVRSLGIRSEQGSDRVPPPARPRRAAIPRSVPAGGRVAGRGRG